MNRMFSWVPLQLSSEYRTHKVHPEKNYLYGLFVCAVYKVCEFLCIATDFYLFYFQFFFSISVILFYLFGISVSINFNFGGIYALYRDTIVGEVCLMWFIYSGVIMINAFEKKEKGRKIKQTKPNQMRMKSKEIRMIEELKRTITSAHNGHEEING